LRDAAGVGRALQGTPKLATLVEPGGAAIKPAQLRPIQMRPSAKLPIQMRPSAKLPI
jgi:hypothetical protein